MDHRDVSYLRTALSQKLLVWILIGENWRRVTRIGAPPAGLGNFEELSEPSLVAYVVPHKLPVEYAALYNVLREDVLVTQDVTSWPDEEPGSQGSPPSESLLETGTLCSICRRPQLHSPGGVTCESGHGGAPPLTE